VADRDQLRDARRVLSLESFHRVGPIKARLPGGLARAG
jgi:hypothetical protein